MKEIHVNEDEVKKKRILVERFRIKASGNLLLKVVLERLVL